MTTTLYNNVNITYCLVKINDTWLCLTKICPNNNIRTPQASLNPGVGLDRRDLVVRSCSNYALTAMDVDSAES